MREYPCTSRELWTLGGLQAGSAFALSIAGWLWGFWVNAKQALDFAGGDANPMMRGQWEAYANMAFWGAVGVGVLGVLLIGLTGFNVWGIIQDTSHEPD